MEKSSDFLTRPDDETTVVRLRATIVHLHGDIDFLRKQQKVLTERLIAVMADNKRLQWLLNGRLEGYDFERLMKDE